MILDTPILCSRHSHFYDYGRTFLPQNFVVVVVRAASGSFFHLCARRVSLYDGLERTQCHFFIIFFLESVKHPHLEVGVKKEIVPAGPQAHVLVQFLRFETVLQN